MALRYERSQIPDFWHPANCFVKELTKIILSHIDVLSTSKIVAGLLNGVLILWWGTKPSVLLIGYSPGVNICELWFIHYQCRKSHYRFVVWNSIPKFVAGLLNGVLILWWGTKLSVLFIGYSPGVNGWNGGCCPHLNWLMKPVSLLKALQFKW